ncbi:fructosamine kinase family protein [Mitsuokella sp.]|uniref:fructosamine kinase family protein n=1 Tax=Mitsuokella sp. TaxID=2049034 RepID=UPI003D7D390A
MQEDLMSCLTRLFGSGADIMAKEPVSGGDINEAYHLVLRGGQDLFLKCHTNVADDFFAVEADGLKAMKEAGARTPEVLAYGKNPDGKSFLLLTYVRPSRPRRDYWENLGHMLAAMHQADTTSLTKGRRFGFYENNYSGSIRQKNQVNDSWVDFFRTQRLLPRLQLTKSYFTPEDRRRARHLLDHLEDYFVEPEYPSLLHGDLWCGNVMLGSDGEAVLIDPAVCVGNREFDIALTRLFGGFEPEFYDAYNEAAPLEAGFGERLDLYNLYHLLNHLHLFGRAYLGAVTRIIRHYAG